VATPSDQRLDCGLGDIGNDTPHYAHLFHTLVNLTMPASNGDYSKAVKALISGYLTWSTHDEN
jgi:hypothetical protein